MELDLYCGVTKFAIKTLLKQLIVKETQNWWMNFPEHRQGKQFIQGRSPKLRTDLLSLDRRVVRIIAGLFTGHASWATKKKTPQSTYCGHCESQRQRLLQKGAGKSTGNNYPKKPLLKLWGLLKRIILDNMGFTINLLGSQWKTHKPALI